MKGIYLVANLKSQDLCENLIYSIRKTGCDLPIRIIHFGGDLVNSEYLKQEAEVVLPESFSTESIQLIDSLQSVLCDCPRGFLYRFLPWFGDWDEFIYSDNDIVALINWTHLFSYVSNNDIVHADCEYQLNGQFSYRKPKRLVELFGEGVFQTALNAGHFLIRKNVRQIEDMKKAIQWIKENSDIPILHDQSFIHIASFLGQWKDLNLCKPPYNWVNPAALKYSNTFNLITEITNSGGRVSHLHYAGMKPTGRNAIEELIYSNVSNETRFKKLFLVMLQETLGIYKVRKFTKKVSRKLRK